jgi:hypothetical protein
MDLQTIIIGLIAMALCVLPILYLQSIRKKEKEKLFKSFLSIASQRGVMISSFDLWEPFFAIGIDLLNKRLIYLSDCTYPETSVQIDLTKVDKCTVEKISNQVNGNMIIETIVLKLKHRSESKLRDSSLVFYQKEMSLNLRDELQLAEKWKSIIESNLQTIKKVEAAPGVVKRVPVLEGREV